MEYKSLAMFFIAGGIVGGVATLRLMPKPQTVTKIETVEKEVVRNNVITRTVEVTKPNGERQVTTEVVDKTVRKDDKKMDANQTIVMPPPADDYLLGIEQEIGGAKSATIGYRLMSHTFVTGSMDSNIKVRVGLLFTF